MCGVSLKNNSLKIKSVSEQANILQESIDTGKSLDDVLSKYGWTYDDLRYEVELNSSENLFGSSARYVTLEQLKKKENGIPVVSFFAGAGGLDLGFESLGFSHLALVEVNEIFCNTLRHNRPDWNVLGPPAFSGDVSKFDEISNALKGLGVSAPFEGVFVGGPPCQPFSIAANQRFSKSGENFKRVGFSHEKNGNLLFDYIKLIEAFMPSVFLVENVAGLLDVDGGEQVDIAIKQLEGLGYKVESPMLLNAANFDVPQNRQRVFIVGNRLGKSYVPPEPSEQLIPCYKALDVDFSQLQNHVTRKHKTESVLRYIKLNVGERDQLGRVDRLDPNIPSKTVIAGGSSGGGRSHLHPFIPRTLSVRESARLQTFPDSYFFTGSHSRQFTQVGNAVPPVLAAKLANSILESFFI